jgi:hypothetical protein
VLSSGNRKIRRHDADDGVVLAERDAAAERVAVEGQRLAERRGVAPEVTLPRGIAQDDHPVASRLVLLWREGAAEDGLHAEHGERRGRERRQFALRRVGAAGHRDEGDRVRDDM